MKHYQLAINWSLSILVSIFLSASGYAQAAPDNVLIKDCQKVVFMGDSITGLGWSEPGGYVNLIVAGLQAQGIKITPIPAGVGGNTSKEMLARLDHDVLSVMPNWMTLSCGVNDVWGRGIDLETYKKNITSIVDRVQAAGIKIVILTATPIYEATDNEFNQKLPLYNEFLHQLAQERKLPLADVNLAWMTYLKAQPPGAGRNVLTVDGVHPNPDGHRLMAQTVLETLGASPEQLAKAEAAWLDLPGSATLSSDLRFVLSDRTTMRRYNALKAAAANQKVATFDLVNAMYCEALGEALKDHAQISSVSKDSAVHRDSIRNEIQKKAQLSFDQKVDALLK